METTEFNTKPNELENHLIDLLCEKKKLPKDQLLEQWTVATQKGISFREQLTKTKTIKDSLFQENLAKVLEIEFVEKLSVVPVEFQNFFVDSIPIRYTKNHLFFPIEVGEDSMKLAVIDPWPTLPYEDASKLLNKNFELVLSTQEAILEAINQAYDRKGSSAEQAAEILEEDEELKNLLNLSDEQTEDLLESEDEEPIKKLMNTVLFQSVKDGASDIHIDPSENNTVVRYRIDGVLHQIASVPKQAHMPLLNRVKVMAGLDISTKNQTQDGRTMILLAGKKIDIRVSILPTVHGERGVLRLLNQSTGVLTLEDLGMNPEIVTGIDSIINQPHGIFLVTGATGSGKTTSLYASLSRLDSQLKNIITIEDPVEIRVAGYGQVQVNEKVGLTFSKGLRSILRQDPDVIMVGEIRDSETGAIAIQSALTGHFVLSTLHTNDSVSSITRLIDMGLEPFLISSTLVGVLAQKLVRRVCNSCKEFYDVPIGDLKALNIPASTLEKYNGTLARGRGCKNCLETGYQGRVGIYEFLVLNDEIQQAVLHTPDAGSIKKVALKNGLKLLTHDCAQKVVDGITSIDELMRVSQEVTTEPESDQETAV